MKWVAVAVVAAGSAVAADLGAVDAVIARGCGDEPFNRAPCVERLADATVARIEERIAEGTSAVQSATARELRAFERGLAASQAEWAARAAASCAVQPHPLSRARCHLAAALAREAQVARALDEAVGRPGADFALPDKLEIFVPLPRAPGGPDLDLGFELELPLAPQGGL